MAIAVAPAAGDTTVSGSSNDSGGFLHLLPVFSESDLVVTDVTAATLPWGTPSLIAASGHKPDDEAHRRIEIAYEWPTAWLRTLEPIGQSELEWLHVQRFRSDFVFGTNAHPFVNVRSGEDPPDMVATTATGDLGIECRRLTIQSRQAAHGLFRAVRRRIFSVNPERFAALRGHTVYLWFNDDDSALALPFRKTDDEAATALVEALAAYQPDPTAMWITGDQIPDVAPDPRIHKTDAGASFYAIPFAGAVPESMLSEVAGFEIGLAYTTSLDLPAEAQHLASQIKRKDRPGSDWLIITAGGPDNLGTCYPAEEVLARALIDEATVNRKLELELKHLSRITVHMWSTGHAVDLWPVPGHIFGPLYSGSSPAFRSNAAHPRGPAPSSGVATSDTDSASADEQ